MKHRIALDVDDVLAAFAPHAHAFYGKTIEKCDYWCGKTMEGLLGEGWFHVGIAPQKDFWNTLPILSKPEDITFDFECYMSSFPEDMYDLRVEWLRKHGFPDKPLIVVENKLKTCKQLGINTIVDDKPLTIENFNKAGLIGVHFMSEYAGFAPVGDKVITNLNQVNKVLGYELHSGTRTL